jgi:hypothetical protein
MPLSKKASGGNRANRKLPAGGPQEAARRRPDEVVRHHRRAEQTAVGFLELRLGHHPRQDRERSIVEEGFHRAQQKEERVHAIDV